MNEYITLADIPVRSRSNRILLQNVRLGNSTLTLQRYSRYSSTCAWIDSPSRRPSIGSSGRTGPGACAEVLATPIAAATSNSATGANAETYLGIAVSPACGSLLPGGVILARAGCRKYGGRRHRWRD